MNGFNIEFDWEDPASARGEELRATWASLSIVIDDQPVTELQDRRTKSVRSRIYLALFPLAEWFVNNWWFLHSESERLDCSGQSHVSLWKKRPKSCRALSQPIHAWPKETLPCRVSQKLGQMYRDWVSRFPSECNFQTSRIWLLQTAPHLPIHSPHHS